jgi:hypothetical protein
MSRYAEIKDEMCKYHHPEVFFAFSDSQYMENSKDIPKDKKIFRSVVGQFGTREGLDAFYAACEATDAKIKAECTAQEVYDYEYYNYECAYTCDDTEALDIVHEFWPDAEIRRGQIREMHYEAAK